MTSRSCSCPKGRKSSVITAFRKSIYVGSNEEIDELYRVLTRRKIPIVSGPEILEVAGNHSISFLDPDGNRVEVACNANKFQHDNRVKAQRRDGGPR
jgi:hypothetical protein